MTKFLRIVFCLVVVGASLAQAQTLVSVGGRRYMLSGNPSGRYVFDTAIWNQIQAGINNLAEPELSYGNAAYAAWVADANANTVASGDVYENGNIRITIGIMTPEPTYSPVPSGCRPGSAYMLSVRLARIGKSNQATLTATAGSATYGDTVTATTSGGSGTGAVTWALGAGSTASGAAVNANTGVISSTSTGTVVVVATKAADASYNAATATATATFTARPITVTLAGSKPYDEGTLAKSASATVSGGTLAAGDAVTFNYSSLPNADVGSYPGILGAVVKNGGSDRSTSYSITYAGTYSVTKSPTVTTGGYSNPLANKSNFTSDTITLTGTVKSATTNNGVATPTFTIEKIEGVAGTSLVAGQVITTPFVIGGVVGSGDDRGSDVGLVTIRADYPGTTNFQGSAASAKILIQVVNPTYRSRLAAGAWPQSGLEAWLNPSPVTEDTYTVRRPR